MQVIPRPHRPQTPNIIPQDNTPVGRQDKKDGTPLELCCDPVISNSNSSW